MVIIGPTILPPTFGDLIDDQNNSKILQNERNVQQHHLLLFNYLKGQKWPNRPNRLGPN